MDKATAEQFIHRLQRHRAGEQEIWDEMRAHPDYQMHEDKAIESILDARLKAKDLLDEANSDLAAFDWVDDGTGNFVPSEEVQA